MANKLVPGVLLTLLRGQDIHEPILQVLSSKSIAPAPNNPHQSRFRLTISDSQYQHNYTMVTKPEMGATLDELPNYSIIRLIRYTICPVKQNTAEEKKIILLTEYDVVDNPQKMIGNPSNVEEALKAPSSNNNNAPPARGNNLQSQHNSGRNSDEMLNSNLTHPISSLSPYQNRWVIKVRVTSKSGVRNWSNARSEGKLFSMDLKDESGEIRATAFNQEVDRFYDMIQVDSVYYISKCQLKPANRQYSTLRNDYEMTLTGDSVIQLCNDDTSSIPSVQYDFVPISQLANMQAQAVVDVIGVTKTCSDIVQFTARASGRELKKREVTLVDSSNASINLTLWGDDAEKFDAFAQNIVCLKSARINEFGGGKTLGMIGGSTMKLNPDIEEAAKLRRWFDSGAAENVTTSLSARNEAGGSYATEWMTFQDAKDANLGTGDKPDYFQCKAFIHNIRTNNAVYKACPTPECNKKVVDQENETYRCEKCNADFPNFKYRLLLNVLVGDWTGNRYVTVFTEAGEKLLGRTSQEIGETLERDPAEGEEMFQQLSFKDFIFKLRSKQEFYGDTARNKITVASMTPMNYQEYNAHMIKELQEITGIGKN